MENVVICNGRMIVPAETLKKDIYKNVHNYVHYKITATQKRLKLEA